MLGALGCVVPEVFGPAGTPNWVNIQAEIFRPEGLNYLDNEAIIHAKSPVATVAVLVVLMGLAEAFRANGELPGAIEGLDKLHPGGPFDPLGLADDPEALAELKVKEIKNGRLAMFSMLGFFVQAIVTGDGPIANLQAHLADPGTGARRSARAHAFARSHARNTYSGCALTLCPPASRAPQTRSQRLRLRRQVRAAVSAARALGCCALARDISPCAAQPMCKAGRC
jgi:hypothetical protein